MRFTNFFFLKNQTRFFASAIICTTKSLSFFALVFFGIWSLVIWIGCFFCSFLKSSSSSSSSSLSRLLDFKLDFFIVFSRALYRLFKDTRTHARTHARTLPRFFLCIVTLCDSLYKGERLFESVSQPFSNNNRATLFKYSLV